MGVKKAERFGDSEERRLLGCLDNAVSFVSKGASPDEAIAKSVKEANLNCDSVPLLVQAYNVGCQTYHREKSAGQGTGYLMSEHPIARVENVESLLFPKASSILEGRKAAAHSGVSGDYALPPVRGKRPVLTKAASATAPAAAPTKPCDPYLHMNQLMQAKASADQAVKSLKLKLIASHDELQTKLAAVKTWCRKNSHLVPETEWNATQLFGQGVKEIFDYAAIGLTGMGRAEKRAYSSRSGVDVTKEPFTLIKAALNKAIEYIQDEITVKEACEKIECEVSKTIPFGQKKPEEKSAVLAGNATASCVPSRKAAFLGFTPGDIFGQQIGDTLKGPPTADVVKGMIDKINSPSHDAEMRSIHSQAMLNDLMSNDEVISGHDPHDVINAYNEISQLTPHMSGNYAVMRSALRKYLTGGEIQPFEAQQLRDLDKTYGPQKP